MASPPWLEITKDVVNILAVPATLLLAYLGFGAWRREHRGKSRYEVARQLLKSTIAYRDILQEARNPMMQGYESHGREVKEEETPEQATRRNTIFAWSKRIDKVNEVRREFYLNRLDAEVLWPDRIPGLCDAFHKLHVELVVNLRSYFMITERKSSVEANTDLLKRAEAVIWAGDEPDKFKDKLDSSLKSLDEFLRPHILLK